LLCKVLIFHRCQDSEFEEASSFPYVKALYGTFLGCTGRKLFKLL
jgi:hypothetical protein